MPWMILGIAVLLLALALAGCRGKRKEPAIGAMCYVTVVEPAGTLYACPVCGNRTLYPAGPGAEQTGRRIEESRRAVKDLGVAWITLDESGFCRTCRPDVTEPRLFLVVLRPRDTAPLRVQDVAPEQLALLRKLMLDVKPEGKASPTDEDYARVEKILQPENPAGETAK